MHFSVDFSARASPGIYPRPSACDCMGHLSVDQEVLQGLGPRHGRWLKITWPMEGWVQAETRHGQPILEPLPATRPNLRQVVTLRSLGQRAAEPQRQRSVRSLAPKPREIEEFQPLTL